MNDENTPQIIQEAIAESIKNIKSVKACGNDEITFEMTKYMGRTGSEKFRHLLNEIINTKEIP